MPFHSQKMIVWPFRKVRSEKEHRTIKKKPPFIISFLHPPFDSWLTFIVIILFLAMISNTTGVVHINIEGELPSGWWGWLVEQELLATSKKNKKIKNKNRMKISKCILKLEIPLRLLSPTPPPKKKKKERKRNPQRDHHDIHRRYHIPRKLKLKVLKVK